MTYIVFPHPLYFPLPFHPAPVLLPHLCWGVRDWYILWYWYIDIYISILIYIYISILSMLGIVWSTSTLTVRRRRMPHKYHTDGASYYVVLPLCPMSCLISVVIDARYHTTQSPDWKTHSSCHCHTHVLAHLDRTGTFPAENLGEH